MPELSADRARALALTPVSRETADRLDGFVALLLAWQARTHLIAASTVPHLWTRHVADSLQLIDLAPGARTWVDVGSGAGFPGLAIACALAGDPAACVHLVESNVKKAAFLREAQRLTGAPAVIHCARMEAASLSINQADVLCARAIAPLKSLLRLCFPLMQKTNSSGIFLKGKNAETELEEAAQSWAMHANLVKSRTDSGGRIVMIRDLRPRRP